MAPRPRNLRTSNDLTTVRLPDAQWKVNLAILTSAASIMDSAVHFAAARKLIDDLSRQTGIRVEGIELNDEGEVGE